MVTTCFGRLVKDPKPLVVGIAWVVECVEKRQRVEETRFLVDLAMANVAGVNRVGFLFPFLRSLFCLCLSVVDGACDAASEVDAPEEHFRFAWGGREDGRRGGRGGVARVLGLVVQGERAPSRDGYAGRGGRP